MDDDKSLIIYSYTRQQALEDGVLIDVTEQARKMNFRIPVAITDTLYNAYLFPPEGLEGFGQSIQGRLNDTLFMAFCAARNSKGADRVEFDVDFQMKPGPCDTARLIAVVGPGDAGEPVLTIMLPGDD
jgi:hypothetical protein